MVYERIELRSLHRKNSVSTTHRCKMYNYLFTLFINRLSCGRLIGVLLKWGRNLLLLKENILTVLTYVSLMFGSRPLFSTLPYEMPYFDVLCVGHLFLCNETTVCLNPFSSVTGKLLVLLWLTVLAVNEMCHHVSTKLTPTTRITTQTDKP